MHHDLERGTCGHMCEYYTQDFMAVLVHARQRHCLHTRWTSSGWLIVLASSGRQEPLTISRQSTTSALHQLLLLLHQTLQPVMAEAPQRQSEFNCTLSHYQNLCWASSISSQHNAALTAAKHRLLYHCACSYWSKCAADSIAQQQTHWLLLLLSIDGTDRLTDGWVHH